MTFQAPHHLWLLLLPLLHLCFEIHRARRSGATTNATSKILTATATPNTLRLTRESATQARHRPKLTLTLALTLITLALARPQWGEAPGAPLPPAPPASTREILIALDLSRSMLATDVTPTRLDHARLLIQNLLTGLHGERIGLILFSGTAFLQIPLSTDYEILRELLPSLTPEYLPHAGSNFAALLNTALDAYTNDATASPAPEQHLIILSDGEAEPNNPWRAPATECKKRNIHLHTLGIGTLTGAMIPDGKGNFVKDPSGAVVLTRLNPATLQKLATLTRGTYTNASQWANLAALINKATPANSAPDNNNTPAATPLQKRPAERYQWFLAPALLLLLHHLWKHHPVTPTPRKLTLTPRTLAALMFLLPTHPALHPADATTPDATAKLTTIIARLSQQARQSTQDTLELAHATLAHATAKTTTLPATDPATLGPINDALQAIENARENDPNGANWDDLRQQLEAFKKTPPQNKNQQPPPQPQDKDKKQPQDTRDTPQQQDAPQPNQNQKDNPRPKPNDSPSTANEKKKDNNDATPEKGTPDTPKKQNDKPFAENHPPADAPKPTPPPPATYRVNSTPAQSPPNPGDPRLLIPLQNLERVKSNDIPGTLFQRMENITPDNTNHGQTW
ncbi:MAG: VWA domain-containing protein [Puniceicoccales bacterium]|nr:VWA domain-containing protein [Puniceicoccales bacterium]